MHKAWCFVMDGDNFEEFIKKLEYLEEDIKKSADKL